MTIARHGGELIRQRLDIGRGLSHGLLPPLDTLRSSWSTVPYLPNACGQGAAISGVPGKLIDQPLQAVTRLVQLGVRIIELLEILLLAGQVFTPIARRGLGDRPLISQFHITEGEFVAIFRTVRELFRQTAEKVGGLAQFLFRLDEPAVAL